MTADVSLPDLPRGVEWLELGTLLSLMLTAVFGAYIAGFDQAMFVSGVIADVPAVPTWAEVGFWTSGGAAMGFPVFEIAVKRIADSAGDGADAQAESDTQAQPTDSD